MTDRKPKIDRRKLGRRSRTKGHTFERWVASQLKPIFPDARRQPQSQISQLKAIAKYTPEFNPCLTDVVAGPFGLECKHRKQLAPIVNTLAQAREDVGTSGKIPVAVHKPHGGRTKDIQVLVDGRAVWDWPTFLLWCQGIAPTEDLSGSGFPHTG